MTVRRLNSAMNAAAVEQRDVERAVAAAEAAAERLAKAVQAAAALQKSRGNKGHYVNRSKMGGARRTKRRGSRRGTKRRR